MQTRFTPIEAYLSALPSNTGINDLFKMGLDPALPFKAIYLYLAAWTDPENAFYFVKAQLVFTKEGVPVAIVPFSIGNDPGGDLMKAPKIIFATQTNNPGPDAIKVYFGVSAPGLARTAILNPQTIHCDADRVRLDVLEFAAASGHGVEALHGFLAVKETAVRV